MSVQDVSSSNSIDRYRLPLKRIKKYDIFFPNADNAACTLLKCFKTKDVKILG